MGFMTEHGINAVTNLWEDYGLLYDFATGSYFNPKFIKAKALNTPEYDCERLFCKITEEIKVLEGMLYGHRII